MYWDLVRAFASFDSQRLILILWVSAILQNTTGVDVLYPILFFLRGFFRLGVHKALSLWVAQNLPRTSTRVQLWTFFVSDQNLETYSSMDLLLCPAACYLFCFLDGLLENGVIRGLPRHQIPLDPGLEDSLILCWWTTLVCWGLPALLYSMNRPGWSEKAIAVIDLTMEQCLMGIMSWVLICLISTLAEVRLGHGIGRLNLRQFLPEL